MSGEAPNGATDVTPSFNIDEYAIIKTEEEIEEENVLSSSTSAASSSSCTAAVTSTANVAEHGTDSVNDIRKNENNVTTTSSNATTFISTLPKLMCPRVDCPEKIIICLDVSDEMNATTFRSKSGDKFSALELGKRAIRMFVMHKTEMDPRTEFSLCIFLKEPTVVHHFTRKPQDIFNTLDESVNETHASEFFSLASLFETVTQSVSLPAVEGDPKVVPPPYIVRVLLVYGRSHSVPVNLSSQPQREVESSPYFFTDVLYIHEPVSAGNKCEEIFHTLCALDHNGNSYIFEESKYTAILNSSAKLLAHPLQRPNQLDAKYKIGSLPTVPAVPKVEEKSF